MQALQAYYDGESVQPLEKIPKRLSCRICKSSFVGAGENSMGKGGYRKITIKIESGRNGRIPKFV